jgi:hypothetical protein
MLLYIWRREMEDGFCFAAFIGNNSFVPREAVGKEPMWSFPILVMTSENE